MTKNRDIRHELEHRILLLDGGFGTMIQQYGLDEADYRGKEFAASEKLLRGCNDLLNLTRPETIREIHEKYLQAGSDVITSNTFNANSISLADYGLAAEAYRINRVGAAIAREAADAFTARNPQKPRFVGGSMGPTSHTLSMSADVDNPGARAFTFEQLSQAYYDQARGLMDGGVDLLMLETVFDALNAKAAIFAIESLFAERGMRLPVIVSGTLTSSGRTLAGQTIEAFYTSVAHAEPLAVSLNCSFGAKALLPYLERLAAVSEFRVAVYPNAGLPNVMGGYDETPAMFAADVEEYMRRGLVNLVGGCCGTTPEFIRLLNGVFKGCVPGRPAHAMPSVLCSPMDFVTVDGITVVGERINPTGKKRFQQALREGDMNYILEQAVSQSEAGAQVLDVNVGAPGVDEPAVMEQVVKALQSVVSLPLQLDSSHADALERGLRVYNGKPIVNSVNGETEVLERVLPLCKKYGAAVVGLAIDERGIQPSADARFAIAKRIVDAALAHGIPREDIYIDCLTLTASAQQEDVLATVEALARCKKELGVRTILGVSNISFGLPCRPYLNTAFLTMAMYAGLDLAIMNPSSEEMMAAVYAYNVLTNRDRQSMAYIARYADKVPASTALAQARTAQASQTADAPAETDAAHSGPFAALMQAVEKGLKGEAAARTHTLLDTTEPLTLVDEALIPALDVVGEKYEKGKLFLPQLLQAASAAQAAFEEIKTAIAKRGGAGASKGRIVLATVKGDVHDIGKNIVRVILENYGFEVIDLGRDVPVETVVDTVREKEVHLVGLSALMTTTLKSMEETIAALHAAKLDCKVMVGGAVLTPEYAEKIGADWYAKDAKQSADIAKKFFGES